MPSTELIPPHNPVRAVFFSAGSSLARVGERLMERFSDPPPPPEPEPAPTLSLVPPSPPEPDEGFHLELELACDPEIPAADPTETVVSQIVLNITTWKPELEGAETTRARTRLEAYSNKFIHFGPFAIHIRKGRLASMNGVVPLAHQLQ